MEECNPYINAFTWCNGSVSRHSQLVFWVVSKNVNIVKISVNVITTPLTDHNAVSIVTPEHSANTTVGRSVHWKLNRLQLQHKIVNLDIEN